ncbi:MAG: LysM peptidoglycan-binding domain-containing M23 family metallopeptidase [Caulobacteraceae bacterium]|nr:LysM peptidoglycan-binding domain-containing M23 family metallopeptidase [Caulobacteraceae bacterium]
MAIALAAASLTGCIEARSEYAPYAGYKPPPPNDPWRPQYPVRQAEQAPAPAAAPAAPPANPAADPEGPGPQPAPTHAVGSQALPPVDEAPAQRTPASYDGGRLALTPLVWNADAEPVERTDVVHRHRLRPEQDAAASSSHSSHSQKAARGRRASRRHQVEHASGDVQPAAKSAHTVTVRRGDTVNSIADQFGTTPEAILKANHLRHPRDLKVGGKLKVPTAKTYVVKPGDTLYSIGRRFDVPVDALKSLNGLESAARLHPGQKIDLPGQEAEAPPPEETPARPARTRSSSRNRPEPPTRSETGPAFSEQPAAAPPPPTAPPPVASGAAGPSQPIPYTSLTGRAPPPPSYTPPPPPAAAPPSIYALPGQGGQPAYPPPVRTEPLAPAGPPFAQPVPEPGVAAGPTDAQVAAAGKGRFIWPTPGAVLSGFGPKPGGQRNDGVDIAAADGAPVRASAAGDVVYAGNLVPGFGNLVLIKHEDGWVTAYAHLSRTEVKIRDHVVQGAEIGAVGSSGGVDQPQLHFEVRYAPSPRERARPIDPTLVLPAGQ